MEVLGQDVIPARSCPCWGMDNSCQPRVKLRRTCPGQGGIPVLQRPNGNRNQALQRVLSRHAGMGARTGPGLSCHCPQLGALWDGSGVEQTQRSRAPLLRAIPFPRMFPKGSSGCLASPCADCSTVAVSHWDLGSPGRDVAVFPKPLWGSGQAVPHGALPAWGSSWTRELPGERAHSVPGVTGSISGGCIHQLGLGDTQGCKKGSWEGSRVKV